VNAYFERLQQHLRDNPPTTWETPGLQLREAAVLAPLFWRGEEPWALLTARPEHLRKHPGQVSFPGGARDAADVTPLHTALREAQEELGIPADSVEVLGMLGGLPTVTGFQVTPFVGVVPQGLRLVPSAAEVAEVLEVPLWRVRQEKRQAYQAERDAYVWEGSSRFIWGATWRMVRELLGHVNAVR
jgi:8-oxo-dGTP pyrophosphatase MutT (NUDIX family)